MKLSALLLLAAAASICVAQVKPASPSTSQNPGVGMVNDQALSAAARATLDKIPKMTAGANQVSCPVVLTSAWLSPYLMLLDTAGGSAGNGLDLEFHNTSGKEIRSMELSAHIQVKKSVYDLDYLPPIRVHLTAYGSRSIDETFAELRHLSLPEAIHPTLVEGVTLEQVTFEDGSVWSVGSGQYCGLKPERTLPIAR